MSAAGIHLNGNWPAMYPELRTEHFELKQILATDQEFIFQGLSNPEVIRYYGVSYSTLRDTKFQMQFYESIWKQKTGMWWKIVDLKTKEQLGACGMNSYNALHQKAEIGYWLLPAYWKKGVIMEVLPAMINHLFSRWKLHRIEAIIEEGNESSCGVVRKLGFTYEGLMRDAEFKNGRWINLLIYSLLHYDRPV